MGEMVKLGELREVGVSRPRYSYSRGFRGSVLIPENFDFRSQFCLLNIFFLAISLLYLFVGIYVFKRKSMTTT